MDIEFPATAVGAAVIVRVLFETASEQGAFPVAVSVIVTLPIFLSAVLGK